MVDDEFGTEIDRVGLDVLDDATCQRLLAETPIGRVVFVEEGDQPMALPVNYLVVDGLSLIHISEPTRR